jgi:hypothetical protein
MKVLPVNRDGAQLARHAGDQTAGRHFARFQPAGACGICGVAAAVVQWVLFAQKLKAAGEHLPWSPRRWPWWSLVAATVAFFAWGFALPSSPFLRFTWYSAALAAVAVLVVSTGLGLATPFFQPATKTA